MELSDQQLIAEAIETNHAGVAKERTLDRYRDHLVHYSDYLASVFGLSFYEARRKHVRMFMNHLTKPGGPKPHDARLQCSWCKTRGYPDGLSVSLGPADPWREERGRGETTLSRTRLPHAETTRLFAIVSKPVLRWLTHSAHDRATCYP